MAVADIFENAGFADRGISYRLGELLGRSNPLSIELDDHIAASKSGPCGRAVFPGKVADERSVSPRVADRSRERR